MSEQKKNAVAMVDEHAVEFLPLGVSEKIRLTASMIRQFIAVPTKSGALPSERDCIRFIMLCRGKRANPFEGDCFLIGYDSEKGPSFSLVCGLELFLKRAADDPNYDGYEGGVIVVDAEGKMIERQGTFVLEGEKIAGGWAKVYRKDRKLPFYKSVKFSTYDTGRSRWLKDPAGMIAKVPASQAHREAFPLALGGLYTQEEMERVTQAGDNVASLEVKKPVPRLFGEKPKQGDANTKPPSEIATPGASQGMFSEPMSTANPETRETAQPVGETLKLESPPPEPEKPATISKAQQKRMFALCDQQNITGDILHKYLAGVFKVEHSKDILVKDYDRICRWIEAGGQEVE